MRVFQILFLLILLPLFSVLGQSTDTLYLDKTKRKVLSRTDAAYYRLTSYSNASRIEGNEKTFYITGEKESENNFLVERTSDFERRNYFGLYTNWYKNGQIQMQINYLADEKEGKENRYYENGQIYNITSFVKGDKQGEAFTYYPDGKLKRKETFVNNSLIEGKCFTKTGTDTIYFPMEEIPVYPGGEAALHNFIKKNLKYNKKALKAGIKGLVVVQFVVDKTGNLEEPEVVKKLSPELDAESTRVVKMMPKNWQPAHQEGKAVSFRFTLPIRFSY